MPMTLLVNETLQLGLQQLDVKMSAEKQSQLLAYLQLLQKWNKTYNLTAITDFEKMISYHLLDSLAVSPYFTGENIVDVGSGAGLPGIPLAIYFPEKKFTLIDSIGKKTRFISHAVRELNLKNVQVFNGRAQEYPTAHSFDTMIARAVASVDVLIEISKHLLGKNGQLLMMKSDPSQEKISQPHRIIELTVPNVDAHRSLIVI
jgi:16S rRNA (guanine527-N7)-methyltransferase